MEYNPTPVGPKAAVSPVAFNRQVIARLRILPPVKIVGTAIGITVFLIVYFLLLDRPGARVTTIPLIGPDRWIGFCPLALPLYLSLWIYVSCVPALLKNGRELWCYVSAVGVLSGAGFAIFLFWPTAVPRSEIDWSEHPSISFLKGVDASGNALPSLHVAFAVFTAVWLGRILREMGGGWVIRALNWLWCIGIVYSTLAIRQHVALDVLSGAALGVIVALVIRTGLPGRKGVGTVAST